MTDRDLRDLQLDRYLDALHRGHDPLRDTPQIGTLRGAPLGTAEDAVPSPDLIATLTLARDVAAIWPDDGELSAARSRIFDRVADEMVPDTVRVMAPTRQRRWMHRRTAAACAAAFILAMLAGWTTSAAAATAMPYDSLYGLKRAEERVALATAWSPERQATVLDGMARARLAEAQATAARKDDAMAARLIGECDSAVRDLIALAAQHDVAGPSRRAIAASVAGILDDEHAALLAAQARGDAQVAAALDEATSAQATRIQAAGLPIDIHGKGNGKGSGPQTPSPDPQTPSADSTASPTATGTPGGNGQGNGQGNGGDSNGNNGNGNGSSHPPAGAPTSATPPVTATPGPASPSAGSTSSGKGGGAAPTSTGAAPSHGQGTIGHAPDKPPGGGHAGSKATTEPTPPTPPTPTSGTR